MKKQYIKDMNPEEIIERLSGGEVIKEDNSDKYFKMINGIICHLGKLYCVINVKIRTDKHYYFEIEPFKIKQTGIYKMRNEKIAYVFKICSNRKSERPIKYVIKDDSSKRILDCYEDGRFSMVEETSLDIIGKWED